jgi:predicted amino acid-binding ACT domain protein
MKHSPPKEAFLIQGGDRVGAVAEILKKLGAAKVNVTAANASVAQGGGFGMILWVKAQDVAAAAKALGA